MSELNLDAMPAVTKAPGRPKAEPLAPAADAAAAPRQAIRDESDRSIRDIPRAPTGMTRQRDSNSNQFALPDQIVGRYAAAGWSLEWKTYTVMGQEDWGYSNALSENGWEPVTTDEIPGFMPKDYSGAIIRDGLMLMKRPAYLTEEAIRENNRSSFEQVKSQEAKLAETPTGTAPRNHPELATGVGRTFEPMEVPED